MLSSGRKAEVEFDGIMLVVSVAELTRKIGRSKKRDTGDSFGGGVYAARGLMKSEIDLRGMRVEEALDEVESYLKVASETDIPKVYLIHGKGTGALQRAVADYLRSSPYRKMFRPGKYGEGDQGVTVVVFNKQADEQDELDKLSAERAPRSGRPKKGRKN
jgi:DNA mismatch repair protein MutS2